jgi:poly(3-hydroxybutyrate) depolymerase
MPIKRSHNGRRRTITRTTARTTTVSPTNRPTLSGEQAPEGYHYVRYVYENPEGNADHGEVIIEGLGHAWSGGDLEGSYTDPEGPDASEEMVRFFRSVSGT